MKRQQRQVTNFFRRKCKCIENGDDSANPASTSNNNSKSDAASIRDHEYTSLCTKDTGAVLLTDSKSHIATADIIGTSCSPTVSVGLTFIVSGFPNWKKASEKFSYHDNSESHKGSGKKSSFSFQSKASFSWLFAQVSKEMDIAQKSLITVVLSNKFLARPGLALRGKQEK
ncbi:hypothetical protein PR048_007277, partial [Dryococelus australis]